MDLDMLEDVKRHLNLSGMSKPALVGIVVILVVVAVAAGRLLIGTATANDFEIVKSGGSAGEQMESEADAPEEAETVFVHVSGAVARPGLCEVPSGARLAEAVQAAGGFTEDAVTDSVNLARVVVDGEQIVVADKDSVQAARQASDTSLSGGGAEVGQRASSGAASPSGLVNINTAGTSELQSLPGIGEATASKIVADRQANGPFASTEDLKRVSGIGDKKYEALSGLICV